MKKKENETVPVFIMVKPQQKERLLHLVEKKQTTQTALLGSYIDASYEYETSHESAPALTPHTIVKANKKLTHG